MAQLIDKSALVAEIERLSKHQRLDDRHGQGVLDGLHAIERFIDRLEVKEIEENKLPNPRFPHLNNIIDKVFGTGNLESFEYEEAEQLVLLAKEELLKDLEAKEVDLDIQRFAKEMDAIFALPSSETENTEENPLNWEYAIAKHFYELGLKAQKGEEV